MVLLGLTAGQSFGPFSALPTNRAKISPTQGIASSKSIRHTCSEWGSVRAIFIAHMPGSTSDSSGSRLIRQSSSFGSRRKMTQASVTKHTATAMGSSSLSPPRASSGTLSATPVQVGQATGRCPAMDRALNSSYTAKQIPSTTAAAMTTPPSVSRTAPTAAMISAVMTLCVTAAHAPCSIVNGARTDSAHIITGF